MLEGEINLKHPALVELVKECLHNAPDQRPTTDDLLARLQRMREEVEGEYGGGAVKVDLSKMRLFKEIKMKDRWLEEQTQLQVDTLHVNSIIIMCHACIQERHEAELEEKTRQLEDQSRQIQVYSHVRLSQYVENSYHKFYRPVLIFWLKKTMNLLQRIGKLHIREAEASNC